ncbi:MAG: cation transporter [Deltaproteobacteria bacterium]|nr:MAG: cation transporter [Deltaproteobacteria bacterium]
MRISFAVALLVLVGKVAAAWITGSKALLSDALESTIHIAATGIAVFSVWYASQPPDRGHPYGHERIVFFSAGMEGGLISIAALSIVALGVRDIIVGPEVQNLGLGLLLTGAMGLVNLVLGLYLLRSGRRSGSLAVEANGQHTLTDVWTSGAVLVGVAVVWVTGLVILDPLVAIGAGLHILATGGKLLRRSFAGLMGTADPGDAARLREALQSACADGTVEDFHALRLRTEGTTRWAEVHLLMPGTLSLTEAHERATAVEERMQSALPGAEVRVTSHIEPLAHALAHPEGHRPAGDLSLPVEGDPETP